MEADLLEPAHILPLPPLASFVRRCFVSVVPSASCCIIDDDPSVQPSQLADATVQLISHWQIERSDASSLNFDDGDQPACSRPESSAGASTGRGKSMYRASRPCLATSTFWPLQPQP